MKTNELCNTQTELVQIGEFTLSPCPHGGLWLCKKDGEGGQINGLNLLVLEDMLNQFWELWF